MDPAQAAEELFRAISGDAVALSIFFCSPAFDLPALAAELGKRFGANANLIGCTTAGEISPLGYVHGTLVGVSLGGDAITAAIERVDDLGQLTFARANSLAQTSLAKLTQETGAVPTGHDTFGFLLVDGLSMQEELLVSTIYKNLGAIPLFGGSAADETRFGKTYVYHAGEFRTDSALLTLVRSERVFQVFKTEHFVPSSEKMVITQADPARRIVTEINGAPAAREYARVVGLDVDQLTPLIFASHPVVVKVGGTPHVRSIQKVNDDESLSFFCAIDEGIVLTVAKGVDMVDNLQNAFDRVRAVVGEPELVLGCDCILRSIEADQQGLRDRIADLMRQNGVIGFATYGEQYNAMHVNQTFTGVAIGRVDRPLSPSTVLE